MTFGLAAACSKIIISDPPQVKKPSSSPFCRVLPTAAVIVTDDACNKNSCWTYQYCKGNFEVVFLWGGGRVTWETIMTVSFLTMPIPTGMTATSPMSPQGEPVVSKMATPLACANWYPVWASSGAQYLPSDIVTLRNTQPVKDKMPNAYVCFLIGMVPLLTGMRKQTCRNRK